MARKIQQRSNGATGGKGFAALLGNAIFWLAIAIFLPVSLIARSIPGLTEYADFAPFLFYGLALFNFVRALRSLKGAAAGKLQAALQQKTAAAHQPSSRQGTKSTGTRSHALKPAASKSGLPVTRTPTVQRMR